MKKCASVAMFVFILASFLLANTPAALSQSEIIILTEVEVVNLIDKAKEERGVCYAGKLAWDGAVWRRQVVVYNGSPRPDDNTPVYKYVVNIPSPHFRGMDKWQGYEYREFPCR